jgi:hypothetical protein
MLLTICDTAVFDLYLKAPESSLNHEELHRNAMKVVCNADVTRHFQIGKDVSLPQTIGPESISGHGGNEGSKKLAKVMSTGTLELQEEKVHSREQRPFLCFYAGQMHGPVRPVLLKHWKDTDPLMKIYEVLPASIATNISYAQHMRLSKFCICPKGFEVNSPRIVESILNGCIPVIIADNFVLPFADVLDWNKFSITVAEKSIPDLKDILMGVPDKTYHAMQRRLKYVRRHFVWSQSPPLLVKKYDVFHMILHSIWTQWQINIVPSLNTARPVSQTS